MRVLRKVLHCERILQWFCCIAQGPCNDFDEFNCEKAGRYAVKMSNIVTCLGDMAKQRLPLQLNNVTCLDAWGQQRFLFGLDKGSCYGLPAAPVTKSRRY